MSTCVISFPTGCIIFMTNYSICNAAEITEIPSHAPWHKPNTAAQGLHPFFQNWMARVFPSTSKREGEGGREGREREPEREGEIERERGDLLW